MRLYLVQHGLAKTAGEDPQRGLSPQGEVEVSAMANWAGNAGIAVKQIQHSGKLRAEQTATILAAQLNPADGVIAIDGLAPNDDVTSFAGRIDSASGDLMLVGHLPFLGRLTALLVTQNSQADIVRFHNSGIVCLLNEQGKWRIEWVVTPARSC